MPGAVGSLPPATMLAALVRLRVRIRLRLRVRVRVRGKA